jgi:hypothetical protein
VAPNTGVHIAVVGTEAQLNRVRNSVAAWRLGDREVTWESVRRFEPKAWFEVDSRDAVVRCWVDLSAGASVRLYFTNGVTQRYLVRTLETSGQWDEMDRETLGQTIELSLLAMLADRQAGLPRAAAESLFTTPPPEPAGVEDPVDPLPERTGYARWEVGAGYAAGAWLDNPPLVHGPALHLGYALAEEPRLAVIATGQYRIGATWEERLASLEAQSLALGVGLELAPRLFSVGGSVSERLALRLGGGAEWVQVKPHAGSSRPDATLAPTSERPVPLLLAAAQSLTLLPGDVTVRLGAVVEFLPSATRYEVEVEGDRGTVFRTPRFRPGAAVAVGVLLR